MCAVIGIYSNKTVSLDLFKNLLNESMIRGKHATGISYIENNLLKNKIIPTFSKNFDLPNIKSNMIIGHCRYSTSDLEYNQPIIENEVAIVHNGVVDQSNPDNWENKYNYKFKTKNDTEILLKHWINNKHPLKLDSSISSIIIDNRNKPMIYFFRNEERPLYYYKDKDNIIIASTKDIFKKSLNLIPIKTKSCYEYKIDNFDLKIKKIRESKIDLQ